jgi:hypothetical protein
MDRGYPSKKDPFGDFDELKRELQQDMPTLYIDIPVEYSKRVQLLRYIESSEAECKAYEERPDWHPGAIGECSFVQKAVDWLFPVIIGAVVQIQVPAADGLAVITTGGTWKCTHCDKVGGVPSVCSKCSWPLSCSLCNRAQHLFANAYHSPNECTATRLRAVVFLSTIYRAEPVCSYCAKSCRKVCGRCCAVRFCSSDCIAGAGESHDIACDALAMCLLGQYGEPTLPCIQGDERTILPKQDTVL